MFRVLSLVFLTTAAFDSTLLERDDQCRSDAWRTLDGSECALHALQRLARTKDTDKLSSSKREKGSAYEAVHSHGLVGQHSHGAGRPKRKEDASSLATATQDTYSSCNLSTSSCSLESLQGPTLIYPGGETRCLNGDAYAFAVVPGDHMKLLYYFQGGGACWEAGGEDGKQANWHCTESMETVKSTSGYGHGIQNFQNEKNPFKSYTVVMPAYCSGDVHIGNASMSGAFQRGYVNALAVLSWAKENFPHELSSFLIAGWSAGSLGARMWAETLLESFRYQKAAVVVDSMIGVLPGKSMQKVMKIWGACETSLVPADLRARCQEEDMTLHDVHRAAMAKFPWVPFGGIQSKYDGTGIYFAELFGQTIEGNWEFKLSAEDFAKEVIRIVEGHAKYPNHKEFLINSDQHCYLEDETFWYASAEGSWGGKARPLLHEWVSNLLSSGPDGSHSQCLEVPGDTLTKCPKLPSGEVFSP